MKFEISKAFQKQYNAVRDKKLSMAILLAIDNVSQAKQSTDIINLKKLKGYKNAYRIRIGEYRIGIFINNNIVVLSAFDHRKDIYRHFPE